MKVRTSLLLTLAFIGMLSMNSCIKTYTCHCDLEYSGYPGLPDSSSIEFEIKDAEKAAKSICKEESQTFEEGGIKTVETCYLY
jgi:hypothetical protein